jgi:hypothetical protein
MGFYASGLSQKPAALRTLCKMAPLPQTFEIFKNLKGLGQGRHFA